MLPRWYAPGLAAAVFVFVAVQDTHHLAAIIAVELLYIVTISVCVFMANRQAGFQPPSASWRGNGIPILVWVAALAIVGAGCFAGLLAAGFPLPGTVSGLVLALGFLAMGRWARSRTWTVPGDEHR